MKAGITNPAAWAAAGVTSTAVSVSSTAAVAESNPERAHGECGSAAAETLNGFDPRPPVVLKKGTNDKTFLISWRSQREVAQSLGWKCTLMIWGGPALALVGLYILLTVAHLL